MPIPRLIRSLCALTLFGATLSAAAAARTFQVREHAGSLLCTLAGNSIPHVGHSSDTRTRTDALPALRVTTENGGLDIILRGTAQLENYPEAKAAFERAAAIWEARIANPITIYVDVDFGPTLFGEPYAPGVAAFANPDDRVSDEGAYSEFRERLVASADDTFEATLYDALPRDAIPTDLGPTTRYAAPSALLRVLGVLPSIASPEDQAPSIGFNSAYSFDFDPSDGISGLRIDFEGIVMHEIAHMLGFVSKVGDVELGAAVNAPAVFDLFRFRPSITGASFHVENRIVSSGGEQVHYTGTEILPMSTGRDDGSGGDGRSASHWKDNALTGIDLGAMDPTIRRGFRLELSQHDLDAIDLLGYTLRDPLLQVAAPSNLTALVLSARTIRLSWTDNSDNEAEFRIEQDSPAGFPDGFIDLGGVAAGTTTLEVGGLAPGSQVTFRVRARSAQGNSAISNEASVQLPNLPRRRAARH